MCLARRIAYRLVAIRDAFVLLVSTLRSSDLAASGHLGQATCGKTVVAVGSFELANTDRALADSDQQRRQDHQLLDAQEHVWDFVAVSRSERILYLAVTLARRVNKKASERKRGDMNECLARNASTSDPSRSPPGMP